jgi:endonuclease-8
MEGPSLFLAHEQLMPFINKTVLEVSGNTKIGKERLLHQHVVDIFVWGKHLVFQFEGFALRVHFLLYGSFEAIINGKKVTGDYPKKKQAPRLEMIFENGQIDLYSCSVKYIEEANAKQLYDYSIDIMSVEWSRKKALEQLQNNPESQIGDVLLDQTVFAGVGNIIKNEVLYLVRRSPMHLVGDLSLSKLREIIKKTREFSFQFYEWRKNFILRAHYQVYRKGVCPRCQGKLVRKKTGVRERVSFFCPHCQK